MPTKWTISANDVSGGSSGRDLVGCHITIVGGIVYQFTAPNNDELATSPGPTLPNLPYTFPTVQNYKNHNWTIKLRTLTYGPSNNQAQGNWSNDAAGITAGEGGDWTAQAGATID
ncbi:MAG TPA: hypothetical protein VFH91_08660, partial [Pyrinomonadaceae bacterium]|nr:hypothetical protein [Pyrinomonadaceae bacterium]